METLFSKNYAYTFCTFFLNECIDNIVYDSPGDRPLEIPSLSGPSSMSTSHEGDR